MSGNDYGHRENRAFDDVTHGEYFVRLPDGRLQTVTYYVDPQSGFRATVAYDREVPAAPANLPPVRVTVPPSNFQPGRVPVLTIAANPASLSGLRVPSPPVRPVIDNSFRQDKSFKSNFNNNNIISNNNNNVFSNNNNNVLSNNNNNNVFSNNSNNVLSSNNNNVISSKNNNVFLRPEVTSQSAIRPEVVRAPAPNSIPAEQPKKNRFLSEKNRLSNLFQDDRKGKSEFNVHNKDAVTKTESELAGQDFSEPVYYPYKTKIVKHQDSILD